MIRTLPQASPKPRTYERPLPGLPDHVGAQVVRSTVSGGRDLWTPPMTAVPEDQDSALWEVLKEVLDPELPISVVDLGLIYQARITDGHAMLQITFTATACPCMDFIRQDIRDRLLAESWIVDVELEEVWDPPWTTDRISPSGKAELKKLGVGT
ncbi:MAG: metal-sulfur cluster assembly factor [Longimicrobiales bacterium]